MAGSTPGRVPNAPKMNYNEMLMALNVSQKNYTLGVDLMQNCDLPPPMKVFTGLDNKTVLSSMNRAFGLMGTREDHESQGEFDGENHDKLEILRALRFSQTRAREAEKKAEALAAEKDCLSKAMLEDAMRLFGHRQLMRLLELQVSSLYSKWADKGKKKCLNGGQDSDDDDHDDDHNGICLSWVVALAFCFGLAGVGFALGYRYLF